MVRQPSANANPYVAIIMLTGHSEKKRVTAAHDAGVTEFFAKPISARGLFQRIVNLVANPRPFIKPKIYFGPDRRRNVNPNYVGLERRKGGKADVIRQHSMLEKVRAPQADKGTCLWPPEKYGDDRHLRRSRDHHARRQAAQGGFQPTISAR